MRAPSGGKAFRLTALMAAVLLAACSNAAPPPDTRGVAGAPAVSAAPASHQLASADGRLNGCDPKSAATAEAARAVTVAFGGAFRERYSPRCVTVEVGGAVRFLGDLALHPLAGGTVIEGTLTRDPLSPLPFASAGTEATFRADRPGAYPYFCQVHWVLGMNGVVFVR